MGVKDACTDACEPISGISSILQEQRKIRLGGHLNRGILRSGFTMTKGHACRSTLALFSRRLKLNERKLVSQRTYETISTRKGYGISGLRYRFTSERFTIFVDYGRGKLRMLGKLDSKQNTWRPVSTMLSSEE